MDDVQPAPRRFELVMAILPKSKYQISLDKVSMSNSMTVVVAQALLIYYQSSSGDSRASSSRSILSSISAFDLASVYATTRGAS